ncbi:MAG: TIGR03808 family TAT-translocated repetitive protein [Tepidamorphaceae bacterium]
MRSNVNPPESPETGVSRRALLTATGIAGAIAMLPRSARAMLANGAALDAGLMGIQPDTWRDQGPEISNALATAARQGKALFLSPGHYSATRISFPDGGQLTGARGQTVLLGHGDSPVIATRGARNIEMSGIDIDGQYAAPGYQSGLVTLEDCSGLRIRDCGIKAANTPLLQLKRCSGKVEDNLLEKGTDSAIFALDSNGLEISGNTVQDMGDNGILVWRSNAGEDGTIISGNRIERIGNRSGGNGQWGNGINIYKAGNVLVSGNRISDCILSAVRNNAGANCQITGNNLTRSGETAVFVEFGFSGAVVANNIIDRAATGISVTNYNEGGRLATVTGNVVRDLYRDPSRKDGEPQAYGIGIAAEADTVVSDNVVENAPWIGLVLGYGPYLNDVVASGNVIRGGDYGIAVSVVEGAGKALVRGNLVSGSKKAAVAGFDHDKAVTGDLLASGAGRFPHLTLAQNTLD